MAAAPQPSPKAPVEQPRAQQKGSQRAVPSATPTHNANSVIEAPALKRPCRDGEDNRNSELCAQWKAAEAASDAAWWAMLGTVVAAAGTLGLYWQIYLTRKAVEDTSYATAAMREANEISRSGIMWSHRAWIAGCGFKLSSNGTTADGSKRIFIQPRYKNISDTPANNAILLVRPSQETPHIELRRQDNHPTITIPPQHEFGLRPFPFTMDDIFYSSTKPIFMHILIEYNDVFSDEIRKTERTVELRYIGGDPNTVDFDAIPFSKLFLHSEVFGFENIMI